MSTPEIMRLDWPHHDIKMLVTSDVERRWRVNACMKEPWTAEWLRTLGPGDLLVNVGACVGSYALPAAMQGAHVIAIEPNILNLARLVENVLLNRLEHLFTIEWCAIGEVTESHGSSMAQYCRIRYSAGVARGQSVPIGEYLGINVQLRELDSVMAEWWENHPEQLNTHLLIDVDGAEADVLEFGEGTVHEAKSVMIEVSKEAEIAAACAESLGRSGLKRTGLWFRGDVSYQLWNR